jgi:hypothetical protein
MTGGGESREWLSGAARRRRVFERLREGYRQRIRPRWREIRPLAIVGVFLAVMILGTIGYRELYPSYSVVDAAYHSIQLFGFGGPVGEDLPWQLEVARVVGPLLTGYAAVRGVIALSREQLTILAFRIFLRDHVVVAGLGDVGFTLVSHLYAAGARVVEIEQDETNPAIAGCRERGISVLIGDATDPSMLAKARVGQAALLFATCGDDGVNADVSAAAAGLARTRPRGTLTAFAHIADPGLLSAIEMWAVREHSRSAFRLETFNAPETAVRVLMGEHPPFGRGEGPVLIVGDGAIADSIALAVGREWQRAGTGGNGEITYAGPAATDAVAGLERRHPLLGRICRITPLEVASEDAGAALAGDAGRYGAVYVALDDEADNMAIAISLAHRSGGAVVALVRDEESGVAAIATGAADGDGAPIVPFGILTRGLTPALVLNSRTETLARAMHEGYRRAQAAAGASLAENPSLAPWSELPDSLKESNRSFAAGIGEKLRAAGAVAVPAPLVDLGDNGAGWIAGEELEALARLEHERWAADLRRDGWSHGPDRDPELRTHPSLVPYDELSEPERQKDRDAVLEIPAILASAGFELHRLPG